MIFVGIDVAKDKHDCFITNSDGEILFDSFTITNNMEGFENLFQRIESVTNDLTKIKVGLEATGHYSYNILGFLLNKNLTVYVINPLHTSLYRKSLSLRKTKTDKVDSKTIATMLMSDVDLKPYSNELYHNEELKSLSRYRFDKVQERAKLKTSIARLVNILFPELEKLFCSIHLATVYQLLSNYPSASHIANATLEELSSLLSEASNGRFDYSKAELIQYTAKNSIGSIMPAKSLELKHTIKLIQELDSEIDEIEREIKIIMDKINSHILTIPGISYRMGAMILSEIGSFSKFDSPDKILAFAGLSPSTYQSGNFNSSHSHMEKRGSKYLRYALFNATKFVCNWDPTFNAYLSKKRAEGKHYNVAISHATKKLVRVMFHLEKTGQDFLKVA
ncbi:MAG: IS110 family transposase [Clostridia bacterium]|nr:IS110 family transposase [Clostridia bacterium]